MKNRAIFFVLLCLFLQMSVWAKPIKALLLTGQGYHDYETQKVILSKGLKERLDIDITIQHDKSAEETKSKLSQPDWHEGYDVVIYNICHAKETDGAFVDSITKVHHEGLPAIAIHCSMHSYHWKIPGKKSWNDMLGVSSPNHGPKSKIKIDCVDCDHPVMKNLPKSWTTPEGELYNIKEIYDSTKVLANGTRTEKGDTTPIPCIWVNQYGKAKIFATTLGHHNSTMQTPEYLNLIANAVSWVTDKNTSAASSGTWKSLFDGQSLKGWNGDPKFWSIKDGALTGITTKENPTKGNTFLIYTGENSDNQPVEYGDFELKLKYRILGHNSGIQYRSFMLPGDQDGWRVGGYQSDMDVGKTWAGTNYGEKFRGILAKRGEKAIINGVEKQKLKNGRVKEVAMRTVESLADTDELAKFIKDAPEWNEMHIIAKGNHLIQKINGVTMSEVIDNDKENRRASGLIAIQLHGGPAMTIQVKDIKIKE